MTDAAAPALRRRPWLRTARAAPATAAPVSRDRLSRRASLLLVSPALLLLGWAFFLPVAALLFRSVSEPTWTLAHYARLIDEPLYLRIILRTLWISAGVTVLALVLGYPIALWIARARAGVAAFVTLCVLIPLWTSVLVRSYGWILLLQRNGIVNSWLKEWGFIDRSLALLYSETTVLVAMSHVLLPFMILPLVSSLKNISPDLGKAALNLGASPWRGFVHVTLPLSLPGIFAGCLMVFVLSLGFYITPALLGGPRTLMIATLISQQATEMLNWPFAGAISFVLLALSLAITFAFRKLLGVERAAAHA
ncbi:ABC transporter permease [Allostella vacuolata]|nr:ABC transporter permease [Stella vacuolata]